MFQFDCVFPKLIKCALVPFFRQGLQLIPPVLPFKVIKVMGNDTDRYAIDDFLLTFPSNHDPIVLYRLRRRFQSKIPKFPQLHLWLWCCDVQLLCVHWLFYLWFTHEHY